MSLASITWTLGDSNIFISSLHNLSQIFGAFIVSRAYNIGLSMLSFTNLVLIGFHYLDVGSGSIGANFSHISIFLSYGIGWGYNIMIALKQVLDMIGSPKIWKG